MSQKSKTPAGTGASRASFGSLSPVRNTPLSIQAQFLNFSHHVRPELAVMVAVSAFGEHGHG